MVDAKKRELIFVQKQLKSATEELKVLMVGDNRQETTVLSHSITDWLNYERRIREVPEWPFNAGIIQRLAASTLAPVTVFLVKTFSGLGFRF